jgi:hypothetical protein
MCILILDLLVASKLVHFVLSEACICLLLHLELDYYHRIFYNAVFDGRSKYVGVVD